MKCSICHQIKTSTAEKPGGFIDHKWACSDCGGHTEPIFGCPVTFTDALKPNEYIIGTWEDLTRFPIKMTPPIGPC